MPTTPGKTAIVLIVLVNLYRLHLSTQFYLGNLDDHYLKRGKWGHNKINQDFLTINPSGS